MKIEKVSETTPIQAQVLNEQSNSTTDTYSADYINNNVGKEVYDDQERVVGTWFGKPLYRKVINFGTSFDFTSFPVNFPTNLLPLNLESIIKGTFFIYNTNSNKFDTTLPCQIFYSSGWKIQGFDQWSAQTYRQVYMCIEYTKTTD